MANQSNAGLFSGPQLQLDMESINAHWVAQALQQQEYFVQSSQINDTVYTVSSEGNCSIKTTSPNSTQESTKYSMVNLDSCHDYSYKNTAKEQEQLFDKELFRKFESIDVSGMYLSHHMCKETQKQMRGRK